MFKHLLNALLCASVLAVPATVSAEPTLAPVAGATDWLNARPSAADLRGRVVIVDVFTVDCYNCQNVVPALRDLYRDQHAHGLAVVGIHSPETPSEKQRAYVTANLSRQGIVWPVAIDNSFDLWRAYGVNAWPTQLIFDRHGRLRKTIVGDSQDDLVRQTVLSLLNEH